MSGGDNIRKMVGNLEYHTKLIESHTLIKNSDNSISLTGFNDTKEYVSYIAEGERFRSVGIDNGTLLLCDPTTEVVPGDLVIANTEEGLGCRLFISKGMKPALPSVEKREDVRAKIVAAIKYFE